MDSKVYRSEKDKVISGVCGGLGEHFGVDPTILRILWALVAVFQTTIGLVGYLVCAIVIPTKSEVYRNYHGNTNEDFKMDEDVQEVEDFDETSVTSNKKSNNSSMTLGLILIVIGGLFILKRFYSWVDFDNLWPALLIVAGIVIIAKKD